MAERPSEPSNKSLLSPLGFQFSIQKLPHVNYFCTAATIPDVSLGVVEAPNPFNRLVKASDKLDFADLSLQFRVDEDMKNYQEIFDWLIGLGYPDEFPQRKGLTDPYSDASLIVTTAQYQPNIEVRFKDLFPTNLASLEFKVDDADVQYLIGSVTFKYRAYDIQSIT